MSHKFLLALPPQMRKPRQNLSPEFGHIATFPLTRNGASPDKGPSNTVVDGGDGWQRNLHMYADCSHLRAKLSLWRPELNDKAKTKKEKHQSTQTSRNTVDQHREPTPWTIRRSGVFVVSSPIEGKIATVFMPLHA